MRVAVTEHAVDRYIDRVEGSKGFMRESIREIIRSIVEDGFKEHAVLPHPQESERRIIPFKSGESVLFLSLGPNTTSFKDAEVAVISVLFEHEVSAGKIGMGVTLGDVMDSLSRLTVAKKVPQFVVRIGLEEYSVMTEEDLQFFLEEKKGQDVQVYELKDGG